MLLNNSRLVQNGDAKDYNVFWPPNNSEVVNKD